MADSRLLMGFHAVTARLRIAPQSVRRLFLDNERADPRIRDLIKRATEAGVAIERVVGSRLDGLVRGGKHQGVVAEVAENLPYVTVDDVIEGLEEGDAPFFIVLDGVQDPHNLGAILRSADAFGAHAVIVPKDRSVGLSTVAIKVASGAAESVPVIAVTNLARTLSDLKALGLWIIGADEGGDEDLFHADLSGPVALVMGAEGEGLRRLTRERCDRILSIPMLGVVSSLNVSVAAGVLLSEARRQRVNALPKLIASD